MKSIQKYSLAGVCLASALLLSVDVEAQRIRNFSGQTDGTTSGAAVQTQSSSASTGEASAGDGQAAGSDSEVVGSYRIGIYGRHDEQRARERQQLASLDPSELYRGVIPGKRDAVDHIRSQPNGANPLTWVGFQPEESRTRVFFQSPRPLQYRVNRDAESGDLLVVFSNARITERNFSRLIDTSYFNRNVTRIEARERRDRSVEVRISLRENVEPSVSTDGQYLYLDFPHRRE